MIKWREYIWKYKPSNNQSTKEMKEYVYRIAGNTNSKASLKSKVSKTKLIIFIKLGCLILFLLRHNNQNFKFHLKQKSSFMINQDMLKDRAPCAYIFQLSNWCSKLWEHALMSRELRIYGLTHEQKFETLKYRNIKRQ